MNTNRRFGQLPVFLLVLSLLIPQNAVPAAAGENEGYAASEAQLSFAAFEAGMSAIERTGEDGEGTRLLVRSDAPVADETADAVVGPYHGLYVLQYGDEELAADAYRRFLAADGVIYAEYDRVHEADGDLMTEHAAPLAAGETKQAGETDASKETDTSGETAVSGGSYDTYAATEQALWGTRSCGFSAFEELLMAAYGSVSAMPSIVVADIDTGINYDHAVFSGRLAGSGRNYTSTRGVSFSTNASDDHGHGTEVASIIAMNTTENVRILPIKAFRSDASYTSTGLYLAIEYAISQKVDVINMSFGGYQNDLTLQAAIKDAVNADILVVGAYGNDAKEYNAVYPASYSGVVGVSAIDSSMGLAYFSNYGKGVDLAAPGQNVYVATLSAYSNQSYAVDSGTSFAAPFVSAGAALLRAYETDKTASEIAQLMFDTATDLGTVGWDKYFGYGSLTLSNLAGASAQIAQTAEESAAGGTDTAQTAVQGTQTADTASSQTAASSQVQTGAQTAVQSGSFASSGSGTTRTVELSAPELVAFLATAKGVKLYWNATTAEGYYVYRRIGSGDWDKIGTVHNASTETYTDKTAKQGKYYQYRLQSYGYGTESTYSNIGMFTYLKQPVLKSLKKTKKGLKLSWKTSSYAGAYRIYRRTAGTGWKKIKSISGNTTSSYVDTKVKKGKSYAYRIYAIKKKYGITYLSPVSAKLSVTYK